MQMIVTVNLRVVPHAEVFVPEALGRPLIISGKTACIHTGQHLKVISMSHEPG